MVPLFSFWLMLLLITFSSCASIKGADHKSEKDFIVHLNKLDSAAKLYVNDTIYCCSNSIEFMVLNTDVKISADGTTHGFLFFTKSELKKWHEYYKRNILKEK